MPLPAVDLDEVAALVDLFEDRPLRDELVAELVEISDLQIRAGADGALLGAEPAEQEFEEGGLARAVGADDPHAVAAARPRVIGGDQGHESLRVR